MVRTECKELLERRLLRGLLKIFEGSGRILGGRWGTREASESFVGVVSPGECGITVLEDAFLEVPCEETERFIDCFATLFRAFKNLVDRLVFSAAVLGDVSEEELGAESGGHSICLTSNLLLRGGGVDREGEEDLEGLSCCCCRTIRLRAVRRLVIVFSTTLSILDQFA